MQRKLIKVGTSAAVLIPKEELEKIHAGIGDTVHIQISKSSFKSSVDPELLASVKKIMERYEPMLKKLASS